MYGRPVLGLIGFFVSSNFLVFSFNLLLNPSFLNLGNASFLAIAVGVAEAEILLLIFSGVSPHVSYPLAFNCFLYFLVSSASVKPLLVSNFLSLIAFNASDFESKNASLPFEDVSILENKSF